MHQAAVPVHQAGISEHRAAVPMHQADIPEHRVDVPVHRADVPTRRAGILVYGVLISILIRYFTINEQLWITKRLVGRTKADFPYF